MFQEPRYSDVNIVGNRGARLSEVITSAANPLLKEIRRAQDRGTLTDRGWIVAEGPHLVDEAVRSGLRIRCLVVAEGQEFPAEADRTVILPDSLFRSISSTESPQGVLALVEPSAFADEALFRKPELIVVLDGLQDPGNAGTIARAAEAFGATGLIWLPGSVNVWNSKTVRASAGSLFRLPVLRTTDLDCVRILQERCVRLYAAIPSTRAALSIHRANLTGAAAIVIGNESRGVSPRLLEASQPIAVPTQGVESLNAGVAASVILFEAARQRRSI